MPNPRPALARPCTAPIGGGTVLTLAAAGVMALATSPAQAQGAGITVTADMPLRFGTFAVFSSGSRTITTTGAITDTGIFPVNSGSTGPAQFTITYDRGNNDTRAITVIFAVTVSPPTQVTQGGITGSLSSFTTNLGGVKLFIPGQVVLATMPNCTTRTCSRSFNIGARLDITRSTGGAQLNLPLPVTANVISVL